MIMGRGRVKGKKLLSTSQDDPGSGEEEKIPPQKRRGRPLKPLKDEMDEEDAQKMEDDDSEDMVDRILVGKKRMRNVQMKDKAVDTVKEENGSSMGLLGTEESGKANGLRPNGNRRKSKPRRAAEAIVECN